MRAHLVSILARSFERALPGIREAPTTGGDVSILARSFERALQQALFPMIAIPHVSILARSFERALRWQRRRGVPASRGFNPRPLFRAGATDGHTLTSHHGRVSILARSFERALPRPPLCPTAS